MSRDSTSTARHDRAPRRRDAPATDAGDSNHDLLRKRENTMPDNQSTALATVTPLAESALVRTIDLSPEKVELLRRTICKTASDDELALFLELCSRKKLDPFGGQIYLVKRKNRDGGTDLAMQTGIDGLRVIAERSGAYCGSDDPIFQGSTRCDGVDVPDKATVVVHKLVVGQRCAFTASARWTEYYPGQKLGWMWRSKPHTMLAKCAEALALRKAFPADLSGLYTNDEMAQRDLVQQPAAHAGQPAEPAHQQHDEADIRAAIDALIARWKTVNPGQGKASFLAWAKTTAGGPGPWTRERVQTCLRALEGEQEAGAGGDGPVESATRESSWQVFKDAQGNLTDEQTDAAFNEACASLFPSVKIEEFGPEQWSSVADSAFDYLIPF